MAAECVVRHAAEERLAARVGAERGQPHAVLLPGEGGGAPAPPARGIRRAFLALAVPQFRWFWIGAISASSGIWMLNVTVPLLLYTATGRAVWAGVGAFAQFVPAMLAAAAGGVLADRYPRRLVLFATQGTILAVAVTLAVTQAAGVARLPVLLAAVAVAGVANGLQTPSWQALVPELVPRAQVLNAVALNAMQANAARAIGPAIAGVALARYGPVTAFAVTATANVVMLLALVRVRPARRPALDDGGSLLRRLVAGASYTRRHSGLLVAVGLTAAVSFVGTPVVQLASVLSADVFHAGALGYGLLVSGLGAGAVIGSMLLSTYGADRCRSTVITLAVAAHGLAAVLLAGAAWFWLALLAVLALGISYVAVLSTANATIQILAADQYRGRAASQYWMAFAGAYPLGALAQGWLTDLIGVRGAIAAAGAALLAVLIALRARPRLLPALDSHLHPRAARPAVP